MKHHIFSRAIAFHPLFVTLTKSHEAAIMLSQMCYWADKKNNGKFWKTCDQWEEELLFSRPQQERARKAIMEASEASPAPWYFETKEGLPAKLYFQIDIDTLAEVCSELPCGRPRQFVKTPIQTQARKSADQSPSMPDSQQPVTSADRRAISETSDKDYIQRLPTYQRVVDTALAEKEAEAEVEDLQEKEVTEASIETETPQRPGSLVGGLLYKNSIEERGAEISTHSMPADYDPFYDGGTPFAEEDDEDLDELMQDEEEGETPDKDYSKEMTQASVAVITNTKVQSPRANDDTPRPATDMPSNRTESPNLGREGSGQANVPPSPEIAAKLATYEGWSDETLFAVAKQTYAFDPTWLEALDMERSKAKRNPLRYVRNMILRRIRQTLELEAVGQKDTAIRIIPAESHRKFVNDDPRRLGLVDEQKALEEKRKAEALAKAAGLFGGAK